MFLLPKTYNLPPFLKAIAILLAVASFGFWAVPPSALAAPQASEPISYVVQLRTQDTSILEKFATNIERRFAFSQDPSLQNIYTFDSALPELQLKTALRGLVNYIEVEKTFQVTATVRTNDPGFTTNPLDIDKQWGLVKAGFLEAWSKTTGKNDIRVAVIDTGVDQTHQDLADTRFSPGYDFINDEVVRPGSDSDDNGHGTLVTGIIGATSNNDRGIAGAAWEVRFIPVKALNKNGAGNSTNISESIVWAADNGANIINLSVGGIGFGHDTTLANAITHAFEKDIVIVAAAGNDVAVNGGNLDQEPVFPICDDNGKNMVLGVGASDQNDLKPAFSNFGKSCIDVIAPGKRILSTINHDPVTKVAVPNAYAYASGTSMSVPYVVAQAVLLKSLYPQATNRQIRDRIIATAENVDALNLTQCGGKSCAGLLGAGRINVVASLEEKIVTADIQEGDVVEVQENHAIYYISGGKRHLVTPFVLQQRFAMVQRNVVKSIEALEDFPEGSFAEPREGTLVRAVNSPTVYYISAGLKLPIPYQVFVQRGFSFGNVVTLSAGEVDSWLSGNFLAPPDGTLVRTRGNPTVYWVVEGVLHPITHQYYLNRGLSVFPVVFISDNDLRGFSKGEAYIH